MPDAEIRPFDGPIIPTPEAAPEGSSPEPFPFGQETQPAKAYAYANLSAKDSLYLVVGGETFEVSQFVGSLAVNEIPTAYCMLAVGRNARDVSTKASIHTKAAAMRQMEPARVFFAPEGEFDPDGTKWWGSQGKVIFEGRFTGFSYRKVSGKVQVVANLIHWLADLGFGSSLIAAAHPANPAELTQPAVFQALAVPGAGANQAVNINALMGVRALSLTVEKDLWGGIKDLFCTLAGRTLKLVGPLAACGGSGDASVNTGALNALNRIEGPTQDARCNMDYRFGAPLKLFTNGLPGVSRAVANMLSDATISSYAFTTFWDKLVGSFCPAFGMAVVPLVNRALVVAHVPAFRTAFATITIDEYSDFDMNSTVERPLRAIGVFGSWEGLLGVNQNGKEKIFPGGCFVADSVSPDDGVIRFVAAPPWLSRITTTGVYAPHSLDLFKRGPTPTETTPANKAPAPEDVKPGEVLNRAQQLYKRYAQTVYIQQMLNGRTGSLGGKLRFDIGPGSTIRINAHQERFIGAEDDLAVDLFAHVNRVTILINAEAAMAGTTFQLTDIRTEAENNSDRTSAAEHPLFDISSIHGDGKHGAPLLENLDGGDDAGEEDTGEGDAGEGNIPPSTVPTLSDPGEDPGIAPPAPGLETTV